MNEKGIREFIEAANMINKLKINCEFKIVGNFDKNNPSSISENDIREFRKFKNNGIVQLIIFLMSFFSIIIYYLTDNIIYSIMLLFILFTYIVTQDKIKNS